MADAPPEMSKRAQRAYEIYRDLGPGRTLKEATRLLGYKPGSISVLNHWSAKYGWQERVSEHDYARLKEALGKREVAKEQGLQQFIDLIPQAVATLRGIMLDDTRLPVLDRNGKHMEDEHGNKLYRAQVKASTRMEAAKAIAGIAGLVPVKRTESVDRTGEQLDQAAAMLRTLTDGQIDRMLKVLSEGDDT